MKKNISKFLFLFLSVLWLAIYVFFFAKYRFYQSEISKFKADSGKIEDLIFLKKTVNSLNNEFQTVRMSSFTSKSTAEFIAKLPRLAEISGIRNFQMENMKIFNENNQEITELKILSASRFPDIANFIELLERSKLPVKVSSIQMSYHKKELKTILVIRIYKQILKEPYNG